jgi:FMN reductase
MEFPQIVIISGSPSKQSRLSGLTLYSESKLEQLGVPSCTIHVADLPAEALILAKFDDPAVKQAIEFVEKAEIVILASPVYKASYSGILKTFLDLLPQNGFQHKVVAPIFIGGTIAHMLAIDFTLKPVISALYGQNILQGIYAVDQWVTRLEGGGYELTDDLKLRLDKCMEQLILELKKNQLVAAEKTMV